MGVLVVDAANVVGSRPDGWWRDRAAAARRLHDSLVGADLRADIVLVVEGSARPGVDAGVDGRVTTVHAQGSGDDTVVDVVTALHEGRQDVLGSPGTTPGTAGVPTGAEVTVVTADRDLRARVEAAGATTVGPGWLLDQL